ncbi:PACE efflux transporter [Moraxella nasovis]|uniref:PACE efflux transporter n=1 Tax=Moraxella nasovis TaxID=2904121 RepID=UPI001F61E666|nr:PACE efflux transporter [Moraxella nasovis]UNU72772.1 PACE efflux transporter [Moraxella nasovis]
MTHLAKPMTAAERIFQAVLFEMGAVSLSVWIIKLSDHAVISGVVVSVIISVIAMVWNVVFNYGFDQVFVGERLNRTIVVRTLQVCLFESGLLLFTVPVVAIGLSLSFWQALVMDIGLSLAIMVYAFIFHWLYDYIRFTIHRKKA